MFKKLPFENIKFRNKNDSSPWMTLNLFKEWMTN